MAERKSLLPPSPRGNASKGGLRSVLFSVRGAFLARRNRRRRGKCSAPVRGAFFHRLRSGSPHGPARSRAEQRSLFPATRDRGRAATSLPCPAHFQPPCRTRSPARPPFRGAPASPSFSLTIPAPGGYNARAAAGTYSSAG